MESKLSRWCDGLIEAGGLAAVIVTPLFFNIHSDRVFEPDKLTLLRSIALVVAAAWLVKFIDQKGWRQLNRLRRRDAGTIWRMPFILPVTLLVIAYLVSNLFSVTPSVSWAGSYQRLQGTFTTLSYLVIFGTTISSMRTRAQARRLVTTVIITSIPVAFYGLLQHFNLDPLPWAGNTQDRVAGHMGNAIFIAAYLIMAIPLTLSRIIVSFNNILNDVELATADVIRSSIYIFTLAIQFIAIVWSSSRGPWLGMGVGIFAFVLILLVALRNAAAGERRFQMQDALRALLLVGGGTAVPYFLVTLLLNGLTASGRFPSLAGPMSSFAAFGTAIIVVVLAIFVMIAAQRGWRWLWFSWILLAVFLGTWLVLFNLPSEFTAPYEETPMVGDVVNALDEWRDLPRIGRLGRILEAESGTGRVRTLIWGGVLELISPHEPLSFPNGAQDTLNFLRPIFGYGPEAMYVAYNRYYPPELATVEARNASPDRSHNETFDALVITGWFGFLVWQFLYLSAFYYGFRWLGVLQSKRERNLLIGLWFGMGLITAVGFALWRGVVYMGVAFPFGSIGGLVLYLIYYALFAEIPERESDQNPFGTDRMLLVALLAAVLSHYVEIHFGIAIAATRTHFFMFLAVMFMVGYLLPRAGKTVEKVEQAVKETAVPERKGRKRKGRQTPSPRVRSTWRQPVFFSMLILGLIIGILGFEFTNYAQPPDAQFESIADLPVTEVVHQSLFVDTGEGFRDSPFVYVMIVLTWMLGTLLLVSEMIKDGELQFAARPARLQDNRRFGVAGMMVVLGVIGVGFRLLAPVPPTAGSTWLLGRSMLLGWGFLNLLGAGFLLARRPAAHLVAGVVALIGLLGSLPVLFAGNFLWALVTAVLNGTLLYVLWDKNWRDSLVPATIIGALSFFIGFSYTYFHAFLLRNSLFFRPATAVETIEQLTSFRVLEASQAAGFMTAFYYFTFLIVVAAALVLASRGRGRRDQWGSTAGYIGLLVAVVMVMILITDTNLEVIQADMIYKRGRFYDNQAGNEGSTEMWDTAIAIYEEALARTPREDYYYLFIGRAYLERSNLAADAQEQTSLFMEAENRLLEAQEINPLNTDHTANLARLNTRRVAAAADASEREQRLETAESFYQEALTLSPQNSVIRNEYGRLAFDLKRDCDQAIELFTQSVTIDPYYEESYFGLGDVYGRCATELPEDEREAYLSAAVSYIEEGLALDPDNARAWLQAANLYESLNLLADAIEAYETLQTLDPGERLAAGWRIDMKQAELYQTSGDIEMARTVAEEALLVAPQEAVPSIQLFLTQLTGAANDLTENLAELDIGGGERPLAALNPADRNGYYTEYPPIIINQTNNYEAIIITEKGEMRFRLYADATPLAVNSFVFLAEQGFYDGTTFHRVLPDFMAQGGDPTGLGSGTPGYLFMNETDSALTFDRRGLLAMANAGADSNGSQFFITFVPLPDLTGQFTIFGEMVEGDAVLSAITLRDPDANPDFAGDLIERIEISEYGN